MPDAVGPGAALEQLEAQQPGAVASLPKGMLQERAVALAVRGRLSSSSSCPGMLSAGWQEVAGRCPQTALTAEPGCSFLFGPYQEWWQCQK